MTRTLSDADHQRLADAIAAAEKTTSGEIYGVVAHQASDYRLVPVVIAAFVALIVPAIIAALGLDLHHWPPLGESWWIGQANEADVDAAVESAMLTLVLLQIVVFIAVAALSWPQAVRLRLTPRRFKRESVRRAAEEQFLGQGIYRTQARTGVLIYVALAEREARVVADDGIAGKVPQAVWDEAVAAVAAAAGEGRLADGLVAAVERCGAVLAEHFPPRPRDSNELIDKVVEL